MRARRSRAAAAEPVVIDSEAHTVREEVVDVDVAPDTQRCPETWPASRLGSEPPPSPRCIVVFVVVFRDRERPADSRSARERPADSRRDRERPADSRRDRERPAGSRRDHTPETERHAQPVTADMTNLDWAFVG